MQASRLWVATVAVVAFGMVPSVATGQTLVPPGNSAINQYKETLPAPGGNVTADSGGDRSPAQVLGSENARRLEQLGADGRAAAALAASTAPEGSAGTRRGGSGPANDDDVAGESSGLSEVLRQATGSSSSGEMGLLLPLVIVAAGLGAAAYAITRRRGAHGS